MKYNDETDKLINKAAQDVLTFARNTLIVNLRFLDVALSRLKLVPEKGKSLATDGICITYDPKYVLRSFRDEHEKPARDYLHMVLHCIFSHMFVESLVDQKLWDIACDIAVESTINDLGLHVTESKKQAAQNLEISKLRAEVSPFTAEKLYHHFLENGLSEYDLNKFRDLFMADDHSGWYRPYEESNDDRDADDDENSKGDHYESTDSEEQDNDSAQEQAEDESMKGDPVFRDPIMETEMEEQDDDTSSGISQSELKEDWKNIAEKILEDLETFSKDQGDASGGMMQNLNALTRERYDYTSFLKKFAVMGEATTINDEEFDYVYYTYGLKLYKNMPLVEPLEYKEIKLIKEFVIAVDTSGSTSGELVQKFLQKTYNIMKSTESFFSQINIHIIQCDAEVQEHVKITSDEEFERYINNMQILGLGGTDFRPVFDFVDELIDEDEFTNLKGLIYFTDGWGTFPARKPTYETAFVFLDNEYNNPSVPLWAIKLILQDEDI